MKKLFFTVTNDLNYDQRMTRICTSLANAGYSVTLVGHIQKKSTPLEKKRYSQKRIKTIFQKGKLFYIEYNIRLFLYLFFQKMDLICAIDLDTILPCLFISKIKKCHRAYDAHELFCEMKEIVSRPFIYKIWKKIEKFSIPRFSNGYTVNQLIADEFYKMYGVKYDILRNVTVLKPLSIPEKKEKYILYQGAVNEGRSFETLIPAMKWVPAKLIIAGNGNFMEQVKQLTQKEDLKNKVIFKGRIVPEELYELTRHAWVGINLIVPESLNCYYSLANKFFDYIHAGVPQLCVNYPAYAEINKTCPIAVLTDSLASEKIAFHLNQLLENTVVYTELQQNCLRLRQSLNWQAEEKKLLGFYEKIFSAS